MIRRVVSGFSTYFEGLRFWTSSRPLLRLSVVPFFIYLFSVVAGLSFALSKIPEAVKFVVSSPQAWYQYIFYYALMALTALAFFFITLFVSSVIGNLVAFPFNDALAEKTLLLTKALPETKWQFKGWVSKSLKNLGAMLRKAMVLLIVGGLLLFAALLPGLGLIAGAIGIFIMAVDIMDFTFDHFQMTFGERKNFIRSYLPEMIGFTGALALTMAIPIINMLALPGSVVAAAWLFSKIKSPGLSRKEIIP
jgi:CysZ protein